jgi:hypothetical protein
MMKRIIFVLTTIIGGLALFAACGKSAEPAEEVYRGTVSSISEDGDILVTQLDGHNYGQPEILFHVSDEVFTASGDGLQQDAFVEIRYSGILTRSIPPQGTALSAKVIASFSEGILQNGVIQSVADDSEGFQVTILPIGYAATGTEEDLYNQIILDVPLDGLEGLTEDDLVEGAQVSAITQGIATASLPPRMPVYLLLPYSE